MVSGGVPHKPVSKQDASMQMSKLVEGRCGVFIDPATIRLLFRDNWLRLSMLAHAIHEGADNEQRPDSEG